VTSFFQSIAVPNRRLNENRKNVPQSCCNGQVGEFRDAGPEGSLGGVSIFPPCASLYLVLSSEQRQNLIDWPIAYFLIGSSIRQPSVL